MKFLKFTLILVVVLNTSLIRAADYVIDTRGAHASVNLKVKHLGYSWLTARFNQFSGEFSYDAKNPEQSKISLKVVTDSFDSNHAKRDLHVKSKDFLAVSQYPVAEFNSHSVVDKGNGKLVVNGKISIRGITKELSIDVEKVGEGKDPWKGYRVGFSGKASITMADFGVPTNLGPDSSEVYLEIHIEGIRK